MHTKSYATKIIIQEFRMENLLNILDKNQILIKNMELDLFEIKNIHKHFSPDSIIEGLVGYSLKGEPSGDVRNIIEYTNKINTKKLSLDVPAGLDLNIKKFYKIYFITDAVLTLALPKDRMQIEENKKNIKKLFLADISIPPSLYKLLPSKLETSNIFLDSEIVKA